MSGSAGGTSPPPPQSGGAEHVRQTARVTWVGLGVNVVLGAAKLTAGLLAGSQALVADAVHSLSDMSTDIAVLVGVRYWSRPPDETHPHGHRRLETLITVTIALVLAGSALGLTWRAIVTLSERHLMRPSPAALAMACGAIATKDLLYRWTLRVGRRIRSPALIANAWHHRSDSFSSVPVALALGWAMLSPAWSFLDHVAAVVVSLLLLQAAWRIGMPALGQLADRGAPPVTRGRIERLALQTPGVRRVHKIRTRYLGPALHVDLHVMVDPELTVREGHHIAEQVKRRLLSRGPDVVDVVVHLEPCDEEPEA